MPLLSVCYVIFCLGSSRMDCPFIRGSNSLVRYRGSLVIETGVSVVSIFTTILVRNPILINLFLEFHHLFPILLLWITTLRSSFQYFALILYSWYRSRSGPSKMSCLWWNSTSSLLPHFLLYFCVLSHPLVSIFQVWLGVVRFVCLSLFFASLFS